jgi:hypothetical protein
MEETKTNRQRSPRQCNVKALKVDRRYSCKYSVNRSCPSRLRIMVMAPREPSVWCESAGHQHLTHLFQTSSNPLCLVLSTCEPCDSTIINRS